MNNVPRVGVCLVAKRTACPAEHHHRTPEGYEHCDDPMIVPSLQHYEEFYTQHPDKRIVVEKTHEDKQAEAFEQWYNTEGWKAAGSGTYDDAKVIWMAACAWLSGEVAEAITTGLAQAWRPQDRD